MANLSDAFADAFLGHTIRLGRYSAGVGSKVLALLLKLEEELEDQILRYDIAGVGREVYKRARAEALLKQTKGSISTAYGKVHKLAQAELLELSAADLKRVVKTLNRALQGSVWGTSVSRGELRQLIGNTMIQGSPAKQWWAKQSRDLHTRFSSQMRIGVAAGETNEQLVKRIRGQRTGAKRIVEIDGERIPVSTYQGGVFDGSKREAMALVRTAVQTVSAGTVRKVYEENGDIVKGIGLKVTLDTRTTLICIALSGGMWDLEGNPLPDSTVQEQYKGPPPFHWNCRTFEYPITYTWEELMDRAAGGRKLKGKLDTVPETVRASIDGEVSGDWNYVDWLKSKSAAEQRSILGPGRYKLWKSGKLQLQHLIDQNNRPLTLDELEEL